MTPPPIPTAAAGATPSGLPNTYPVAAPPDTSFADVLDRARTDIDGGRRADAGGCASRDRREWGDERPGTEPIERDHPATTTGSDRADATDAGGAADAAPGDEDSPDEPATDTQPPVAGVVTPDTTPATADAREASIPIADAPKPDADVPGAAASEASAAIPLLVEGGAEGGVDDNGAAEALAVPRDPDALLATPAGLATVADTTEPSGAIAADPRADGAAMSALTAASAGQAAAEADGDDSITAPTDPGPAPTGTTATDAPSTTPNQDISTAPTPDAVAPEGSTAGEAAMMDGGTEQVPVVTATATSQQTQQTQQTNPAEATATSTAARLTGEPARTASASGQVATAVAALQRQGDGEYSANIDLHPAELGRVRVTVNVIGGVVDVSLAAEQGSTRSLVASQLEQLRQALSEAGLDAGSLDVNDRGFGGDEQRSSGGEDAGGRADDGRAVPWRRGGRARLDDLGRLRLDVVAQPDRRGIDLLV